MFLSFLSAHTHGMVQRVSGFYTDNRYKRPDVLACTKFLSIGIVSFVSSSCSSSKS
jgi:hypothetical protein